MKNHRLPYAQRLRGVAAAASLALPTSVPAKRLKASTAALEAAVKVGADRSAIELLAAVRRDLHGLPVIDGPGYVRDLSAALQADGREAANRLAGMIRRNDPDPEWKP